LDSAIAKYERWRIKALEMGAEVNKPLATVQLNKAVIELGIEWLLSNN